MMDDVRMEPYHVAFHVDDVDVIAVVTNAAKDRDQPALFWP